MKQPERQPVINGLTVAAIVAFLIVLTGAIAATFVWLSGNLETNKCANYCGSLLPGDSAKPAQQILAVSVGVALVLLVLVWLLRARRAKPSKQASKNGIIKP